MKIVTTKLKNLSYRTKGWIYYFIAAAAFILEDAPFSDNNFFLQLLFGLALIIGFTAAGRNWILGDIERGSLTPKLPKNRTIVYDDKNYTQW